MKSMDNSPNGKLEKYFLIIAAGVFFFALAALLYRQFIYLPEKKAEYIRSITPTIAEERTYFTPEEDAEMREAYKEIMLQKYGKKVEWQTLSSTSSQGAAQKK